MRTHLGHRRSSQRGVGKGNNKSQTKRDQLWQLTVLKREIAESNRRGKPIVLGRIPKHKNAGGQYSRY